jgi:hypothetical protein
MTNKLREAFERAQQRTDEEQNYIADLILRELEDQEWEASAAAREAIEGARAEFANGDSMDYEEYARNRRGVPES